MYSLIWRLGRTIIFGRNNVTPTFNNFLSAAGIFVGVLALLCVSSVMNGFSNDMIHKVVGLKGEVRITKDDFGLLSNPDSLCTAARDYGFKAAPQTRQELVLYNGTLVAPAVVWSIDPIQHENVTAILSEKNLFMGEVNPDSMAANGIVMGADLAQRLNLGIGQTVQLISPQATRPTAFGLMPKTVTYKLVAVFSSEMPEYDRSWAYISYKSSWYNQDAPYTAGEIILSTGQPFSSAKKAVELQKRLGAGYLVEDWSQFDRTLYHAMKLEKRVMFLVLALMVLIAGFNMMGNFIKAVVVKRAEIGVLRAIGAPKRLVVAMFVAAGTYLGGVGTIGGTLLAWILLSIQAKYHLLVINIAGFPLSWVPVSMRWSDFVLVFFFSLAVSALTAVYPAWRAARLAPATVIRQQ